MTLPTSPHDASRRRLVASLGASALVIAAPCRAQSSPVPGWPVRPVKVVVPGPAGSQTDLFARFVAEHFAKVFGQPFVVDNKPGGSGIIGSMAAAKAAPDGYTLLLSNASFIVVARALGVPMAYELNELAPIAQLAVGGTILSVAPELPVRTVKELVAYLAAQPAPLSYGTLGNGSSSHLTMEWLMSSNGLKATHVPYKSGSEVGRDLAGGVIPMGWVDTSTAVPLMKAGRIRGLAVNATLRMPATPEVPTLTEAGYRFETNGWQAVFVTGGTPEPVVRALGEAIAQLMQTEEARQRVATMNAAIPAPHTPEMFARMIQDDLRAWRKIAVDNGIKAQ
jgi:tripartite-type tricarboxylate transporter receptor subunit TctC